MHVFARKAQKKTTIPMWKKT